jgi:splicing factor 3A subunit 2
MTEKAERNEYYSLNAMGSVVCKLCDTMHRDEAAFAVHLTGVKHRRNLQILAVRRETKARENQIRLELAREAGNDARRDAVVAALGGDVAGLTGGGAGGSAAPSAGLPARRRKDIGPPQVDIKVDAIGDSRTSSRIMFTVHYPLVSTGETTSVTTQDGTTVTASLSRPMHRWLNTFEQRVEARDESKQYLVFACDPYQTVAYAFPAKGLLIATPENTDPRDVQRYYCRWDPVEKTYLLMFTISHR